MGEEIKKEKSRYQKIISGEVEPIGQEKGYKNLEKRTTFRDMSPERAKEIRQMGQKAQREIYGKKKTARESIEQILSIKVNDEIMSKADLDPSIIERVKRTGEELTFYDLVNIVAVGRAVGGSINAMQYVRDTNGDKPTDKIEMTTDIMTDRDRELLERISARIEGADEIAVVRNIEETGSDPRNTSNR